MAFTFHMPRWITGGALAAGLVGLCCLATFSYLDAKYGKPDEQTFVTTSTQQIGQLTWKILDCDSGAILSQGSRPVLASEVHIVASSGFMSSVLYSKRLPIDGGFYIDLAESPERQGDDIDGFGFGAARDNDSGFSWEWFEVDQDSHATKIQESGDLGFSVVDLGGRWEVARTDFLSNVSFRVFHHVPFNVWRNKPRWRIEIEKGSYVTWPSLKDGAIVLN